MEWRVIPGFPGYEINRKGVIRKPSSGYVMSGGGKYPKLSVNGRQVSVRRTELLAAAFASEPTAEPLPDTAPAPDDIPAPNPAADVAPSMPEPAPVAEPAPEPGDNPITEVLRADLADARRSLALARRVNGHLLALVAKLRAGNTSAATPKQPHGRGRGRGRKRKEPADTPDYIPSAGDVEPLNFEDDYF